MDLPLHGVTILDLSRLLPGPIATQLLADFGADVIKIEDPKAGDRTRSAAPLVKGIATRHLTLNRNKRCLALDLKSTEGKEIFLKLSKRAHVILEQFRPGVMGRLGLEYAAIKAINPAIVYCSLSGFGQQSPYRELVAHDINYLSLSGVLSLLGRRGTEPALSGPQLADISAGYMAALGIMIALRKAERTSHGDYVDISLFDSVFALATTALATFFGTGKAPIRGEERHNGKYAWSDMYRTADGQFITIQAAENHFYRNLCRALGREEWYELQYADEDKQEEMRRELRAIFLTRTRDEWFATLRDKDVCIAPVLTVEEAIKSPHVQERGNIIKHRHPIAGDTYVVRNPIRMENAEPAIRRPAPALGEHSGEILSSLGYSEPEITRLFAAGVIALPE